MGCENETLRWPTNLSHDAIVLRLIRFRETALSRGLPDLAAHFADLDSMSGAKIGTNVVIAINWLLDKAEYQALATQLEMVAMNLKNLRDDGQDIH